MENESNSPTPILPTLEADMRRIADVLKDVVMREAHTPRREAAQTAWMLATRIVRQIEDAELIVIEGLDDEQENESASI